MNDMAAADSIPRSALDIAPKADRIPSTQGQTARNAEKGTTMDNKPQQHITRDQARAILKAHHAKHGDDASAHAFFSVTFQRRTDKFTGKGKDKVLVEPAGTERTFRACRFKVKCHLADPQNPRPAYDASAYNLLHVYVCDGETSGYRSINLDSVTRIALGGVVYAVEGES